MSHLLRAVLFVVATGCLAASTHAVGVTLEVARAESVVCYEETGHGATGAWCESGRAASVAPAAPRGGGDLQLDAAGNLILGSLSLEAFSLDGELVPAWSGDLEADLPVPATGWPVPAGRNVDHASISLTRFTSQSDFAGVLLVSYQESGAVPETWWTLELAFASVPGGVVACPGETLFLDDDGDGKVNARDAVTWPDDQFGDAIDAEGRTPSQFCFPVGDSSRQRKRLCERLDYRNDEPALRRPRDCELLPPTRFSDWSCSPAELVFRSAPPVAPARSCLGYPVVDDADDDGEPDATDLCPSTPAGSSIDGDGCTAQQFCSQQSVLVCRRADFRNDEALEKKPRDCALTRQKPRACTEATGL